jgi:hypothetical protein
MINFSCYTSRRPTLEVSMLCGIISNFWKRVGEQMASFSRRSESAVRETDPLMYLLDGLVMTHNKMKKKVCHMGQFLVAQNVVSLVITTTIRSDHLPSFKTFFSSLYLFTCSRIFLTERTMMVLILIMESILG